MLKKVESALKEVAAWVISTYKITDYKVSTLIQPDGTRVVTISTSLGVTIVSDPFKVMEVLRTCVTWVVDNRETEIREKSKHLSEKEQELTNLRRILIAFESSDKQHAETILHTPVRPGHSSQYHNGLHSSAIAPSAPVVIGTPEPKPSSSSVASAMYGHSPEGAYSGSLAMTPSGGGAGSVRWSGAKSALLQASPAAKQAAKLHSEVLKEVNILLCILHIFSFLTRF